MPKIDNPYTLAALALAPEQLPAYVRSVAGSELRFAHGFAVYLSGHNAVIIGYPTADDPCLQCFSAVNAIFPMNSELDKSIVKVAPNLGQNKIAGEPTPHLELNKNRVEATANSKLNKSITGFSADPELDNAIAEVSGWNNIEQITVLAAARPASAPVKATGYAEKQDVHLVLDLPFCVPAKNFASVSAGDNFLGAAADNFFSTTMLANDFSSSSPNNFSSLLPNNFSSSSPNNLFSSSPNKLFSLSPNNFSNVPRQKLRNQLRRAARDLDIAVENWGAECQALARSYTSSRALESGTRYIFENLEAYAASTSVKIFTARLKADASLQALCIGDYTALATAFYMFAFRQKSAVPGSADLLLYAMLQEAERQGHERVNLGLAINGGIGFFKEKWGARNFMPLVECSWPVARRKKGFLKGLFG